MRNTKDIADAVFRIRDEHLEKVRMRNNRIKKACAAVSAFSFAGVITAAAVYLNSDPARPARTPDEVSVIEDVTHDVTTGASASAAVQVTETTLSSMVSSADSKAKETASAATATVTAATSAKKKNTTPTTVTSASSDGRRNSSTATAAPENKVSAVTHTSAETTPENTAPAAVTATVTVYEKEELRMKVESIKKYLAALSAAALSSSALPAGANAAPLYSPKEISPYVPYLDWMDENEALIDFDGNGKFNAYDAYALYAYVNEPDAVPADIAERCAANGDINNDGAKDNSDFEMVFFRSYRTREASESENAFFEGKNAKKIISIDPAEADEMTHFFARMTLAPDCTEEEKEMYLNEYIYDTFTYGSPELKDGFHKLLLEYSYIVGFYNDTPYMDYQYLKFADSVKDMSFDVNEDGAEDMKDLYDFFLFDTMIYDLGLGLEYDTLPNNQLHRNNDVEIDIDGGIKMITYDTEHTVTSKLQLTDADKDRIVRNCTPWYEKAKEAIFLDSFYDNTPFYQIARYIMNNCEVDSYNTRVPYYVSYRGDINVNGVSAADEYTGYIGSILYRFFDKSGFQGDEQKAMEAETKFYLLDHYDDSVFYGPNEDYVAFLRETEKKFEAGLMSDILDINRDGVADRFDYCSLQIYAENFLKGIPCEYTVLPQEQWDYIETEFDPDGDGITATIADESLFHDLLYFEAASQYEPDHPYIPNLGMATQYESDLYFLKLLEQKGILNVNEIKPYLAPICESKELGDVDLDGNITAMDASEVLTYFAKTSTDQDISPVNEAKMSYLADYNGDNIIDGRDASAILTTYAKNSVEG